MSADIVSFGAPQQEAGSGRPQGSPADLAPPRVIRAPLSLRARLAPQPPAPVVRRAASR